MRLPLSWLKEFLPKLPPVEKLTEQLMMHGLEVEDVIDRRKLFDNVVVGQILAIRPHPNADKLRLADVTTSNNGLTQEIVCGAPNIEVGQKIPVALLGATLPNGLTIAKRDIRGVTSNGMLCAEDELGLGKNHSGIMVLDPSLKVGTPLAEALGADDIILDISIPANRSDLFSVRGLAREAAAIVGATVKFPKVKLVEDGGPEKKSVSVEVAEKKMCPLYNARVIRGVTIQSSPPWLQNRLRGAGMRPINAVVDATNYIMLEYGQPLHAFDAALVSNDAITVRAANKGEKLMTLDNKERQLDPSMLVIADGQGPIALAGVMGGKRTLITDSTRDIILESAIFDPVSIRRTSRSLGLSSEASRRFEKGLPLALPEEASQAAAALIVKLCGGSVEQGSVVVGDAEVETVVVSMKPSFISELLGMTVTTTKAKSILTKLGFNVTGTTAWKITVPSWRLDVTLPEDLVDEVGRMIGYDQFKNKQLANENQKKELPPDWRFKEEVRNILVELGLTEIISHAFYSEKAAGGDELGHFIIANPLDKTQHMLRKHLLQQVQDVLGRQADAGHDAMVFEIGRIFDPNRSGEIEEKQPWKLALGLAHKDRQQMIERVINQLQTALHTSVKPDITFSGEGKGNTMAMPVRGRSIELCEFDLSKLMDGSKSDFGPWNPDEHVSKNVVYRKQSKFPAVKRDISLYIPETLEYDKMLEEMVKSLGPQKDLLDVSKINSSWFNKDGKKSITFSLVFQAPDRTLTKDEVDAIINRLVKALTSLGATIR